MVIGPVPLQARPMIWLRPCASGGSLNCTRTTKRLFASKLATTGQVHRAGEMSMVQVAFTIGIPSGSTSWHNTSVSLAENRLS